MFNRCLRLEKLTLSNFNAKNVEYMEYMFNECSSLKELDLSNFDINQVKDMRNMFKGCSVLEELNIDNFRLKKDDVSISGLFNECNSLKKLICSDKAIREEYNK